jgi:hypothetical protein
MLTLSLSRLRIPSLPARDLPDGQISHLPVQPLREKYFASPPTQITSRTPAIPSHTEGRFAIVTDVGHGMRWTRAARLTNRADADGEVVWS